MKTLICSLFTALLLAAPAFSQRGPEGRKHLTRPSHSVKDFEKKQHNAPRGELKALRKEVETLKKEVAMLKRAMRMRGAKPEGKSPQGRKGRTGREGSRRKGRGARGGQSERPGGIQISEDIKKKILEKIQEHKSSKKVA
tara:strand:+ start:3955 stop:4374 length:420 start_codon:yes stop_codon:yes gene_type:complete